MDRDSQFFTVMHNWACNQTDLMGLFDPDEYRMPAGLPDVSPICPDQPAGLWAGKARSCGKLSELFRNPYRPTWVEPP